MSGLVEDTGALRTEDVLCPWLPVDFSVMMGGSIPVLSFMMFISYVELLSTGNVPGVRMELILFFHYHYSSFLEE